MSRSHAPTSTATLVFSRCSNVCIPRDEAAANPMPSWGPSIFSDRTMSHTVDVQPVGTLWAIKMTTGAELVGRRAQLSANAISSAASGLPSSTSQARMAAYSRSKAKPSTVEARWPKSARRISVSELGDAPSTSHSLSSPSSRVRSAMADARGRDENGSCTTIDRRSRLPARSASTKRLPPGSCQKSWCRLNLREVRQVALQPAG